MSDGEDARRAKMLAELKLQLSKEMTEKVAVAQKELERKLRRNEFSVMIDRALRGQQ